MRLLILSNASFLDCSIRTGLQQLAFEWAQLGATVDYVSCPLHPLDFVSRSRRARWRAAWFGRGTFAFEVSGVGALKEHFIRVPFSRHKRWWRSATQLDLYRSWIPSRLGDQNYDVCLLDTSYAALFADRVKARHFIYRINDHPEGFQHHMSDHVISWFSAKVRSGLFKEAWPVSDALSEWVVAENAVLSSEVIPNGVALDAFSSVTSQLELNRAVYLGAFNEWFDWDLLVRSARLLPEGWSIDLYGPLGDRRALKCLPVNVHWRGAVEYDAVPELLGCYSVGLLPFKPHHNFLDHFDPLKAYQYWAAGLGVAATDYGRMQVALSPWANYGNTPEEFAQSIVQAQENRPSGDPALSECLKQRSWSAIGRHTYQKMRRLYEGCDS
tara:strand:- start:2246 stop:3397 length:1152 start_codon:yes stop_codon:yes gene_type:complete